MFSRLLIIFALVLFAQVVLADVTVTFQNCSPGLQHAIDMSEGSPVADQVQMGVYNWLDVDSDQMYQTFCIDAETLAGGNPVNYQCVPLTEARAEPGLAGGQLTPFRAYLLEALWGQYSAQTGTNEGAAAFGLAVYEIVYDGDSMVFDAGFLVPAYDFEAGIFDGSDNGNSTVWPVAKGWLQTLDYYGLSANLIAWAAEGGQDQILPDDMPTATSESTWGQLKALF